MQDETATKLTDAIIRQSALLERNCGALDRLEKRLAIQPGAPLDPRTLVARTILVAGLAALVGACTALAWAGL
jgi:hypothetical protein